MSISKGNKVFDSLLVLQYQSGNKKALNLLVSRWNAKLCRQAYWYTQDLDISKDIVQDSWDVILTKIYNLKDPNRFGSWALTIVTRNAINWLRKHKKELEHLNAYNNQHDKNTIDGINDDVKEQVLVRLKLSIKELPIHQQVVLNLFYIEEYSIKEISKIIDVSAGTVKSRLFTAREKLKLILNNRNYEE